MSIIISVYRNNLFLELLSFVQKSERGKLIASVKKKIVKTGKNTACSSILVPD